MSNQSQELKITVPSITEIEAPLGGTTLAYNVTVTEGSLSYNVTKTFREFEDLAKKLQKKYQNLAFPSLNQINADPNIRRKVADQFMTFISGHSETANGPLIKQFLGIDSEANYQITTEKITTNKESSDEPDSLFETLTQKPKTVPIPIENAPIENTEKMEKNDLIQEFKDSDKIMSQQRGKTSFFDIEDEDDDDDLFKITKPKPQKPPVEKPKKPASMELFESEGIQSFQTKPEINENLPVQENEAKDKIMEHVFDESEIDDSILKLEDNLEDLSVLSLTPKKPAPTEGARTKPVPPPKKPSLMKKPAVAPKPGAKPIQTKNIEDIDISSYINAEEAASQEEAKLFD